ncbi:hypothetical protein ColLi_03313 [Colletotrichum liriopes]|uniref:Uncharacterized protein n=1 Tax=Colletotrichum liriopes TaxID=708192 RepID=A0AA37GH18_9PEZI|nr:hypothetical protein ColLi_03313 [Colletotrichum liriopes]
MVRNSRRTEDRMHGWVWSWLSGPGPGLGGLGKGVLELGVKETSRYRHSWSGPGQQARRWAGDNGAEQGEARTGYQAYYQFCRKSLAEPRWG